MGLMRPSSRSYARSFRANSWDLRRLLVVGATAVIQQARRGRGHHSRWLLALIKRKPPKLAAVALANKVARIVWKLMVTGESYDAARLNAATTGTA
ncbi:transposase [Bradyrhizobium sp. JR3.5]